ncbi:8 kDa protein [Hosta virus X]|uniref:8 kDa protein n=1 Tax=Hosta virus X TaxID=214439 RepID=Q6Y594_9VIRU|nr:8 kDa protein [Hosta virus X]AAO60354.1 TGB3 [Hosta virus X]AFM77889.1 TGBp3 [Hosta virus X]AQT33218.1 TGB3 [Hosta virus X]QIQ53108.1 TGB3 [Hosta virus X]WNN25157.1 TGB3 [Hosta virus X]
MQSFCSHLRSGSFPVVLGALLLAFTCATLVLRLGNNNSNNCLIYVDGARAFLEGNCAGISAEVVAALRPHSHAG